VSDGRKIGHGLFPLLLAVWICIIFWRPGNAAAKDAGVAGLTRLGGALAVLGRLDEDRSRSQDGRATSRNLHSLTEEDLTLRTGGFVIHPRLLDFDLSGRLLFTREKLDAGDTVTASSSRQQDYGARLNFLSATALPFTLFTDRTTVRDTGDQRWLTEATSTGYGLSCALLQPLLPMPLQLFAEHRAREGRQPLGTSETVDRASVTTTRWVPWLKESSLVYSWRRQETRTTDPAAVAESTRITTQDLNANLGHSFGAGERWRTRAFTALSREDGPVARREARIAPSLEYRPSRELTVTTQGNYLESRLDGVRNTGRSGSTGINWEAVKNLTLTGELHGAANETGAATLRTWGGRAGGAWRQPAPWGTTSLNGSLAYDLFDMSSPVTGIRVLGERHAFPGLTPVELARERITASSIEVFNLSRTVRYAEGTDYRLIVAGTKLLVERLLAGAIPDGAELLVDYSYTAPGTFRSDAVATSLGASVGILSHLTLSVHYQRNSTNLLSGSPARPLNSSRNWRYTAELVWPFSLATARGSADYEDNNDELAPYRRTTFGANLMTSPGRSLTLSANGRRSSTDFSGPGEDSVLTTGSMRLDAFPWLNLNCYLETGYQRWSTDTTAQETTSESLGVEWRFRQLSFRGVGKLRQDRQEITRRTASSVEFEMRREF